VVLMLLIQLGGLGYMTISTLVAVALGRRVTMQERLTLQEALNIHTREGLLRFTGTVFKMTLALELVGALILAVRWPRSSVRSGGLQRVVPRGLGVQQRGLQPVLGQPGGVRGDLTVNLVITTLIVCGGLGFLVLSELGRIRQRMALSVHTKFALVITAVLIVGGTVGVFLLSATTRARSDRSEMARPCWPRTSVDHAAHRRLQHAGHRRALAAHALPLDRAHVHRRLPGGTGGGVKTTTFGSR
jgi:trk system potassium uptake protein TrkH